VLRTSRVHPLALAAGAGAVWGAVSFAVLWGYTSIQVTRPFVQSVPGLLTLLPVRTVIFAIHLLEERAGRSFDLSSNHEWIGFVSAAVGAFIVGGTFALVGWLRRARRRPGGASR
jgi:hypothetical protein